MRKEQAKDFKAVRSKLEEICEKYRIYKIKLENLNNEILNSEVDEKRIQYYRNYVNTVDLILKCLDPDMSALIKNINFHKIPSSELGYSTATYYSYYRKAAESFLRYLS